MTENDFTHLYFLERGLLCPRMDRSLSGRSKALMPVSGITCVEKLNQSSPVVRFSCYVLKVLIRFVMKPFLNGYTGMC